MWQMKNLRIVFITKHKPDEDKITFNNAHEASAYKAWTEGKAWLKKLPLWWWLLPWNLKRFWRVRQITGNAENTLKLTGLMPIIKKVNQSQKESQ